MYKIRSRSKLLTEVQKGAKSTLWVFADKARREK